MCGIAGFSSNSFSLAQLHQMTHALEHRGPDAAGFFFDESIGIGLGHRRLSILDLSESANQPFVSHCGRYSMIYNGEVYNFQEIRSQLAARNWRTNGDTEVILEAFVAWGPQAVEQFNGMFSIAIWDKKEHELHLFRDRMGIKPLFYFQDGADFVFASELKAIVPLVKHRLSIHKQAIYHFLHVGYIPQEETIYQEIKKFPAGYYGCWKQAKLHVDSYWKPIEKIQDKTITNEAEAKTQLHELLIDSVQSRLISDVSLGTFLSGGIDSSTITAIAQSLTSQRIKTFSIGFKEQSHNESQYAEKVAKHLNTEHHPFLLSEQDAIEKVADLLTLYDQPFADSSAIPTRLVSEMAKKQVTVALSGDGGDEQFMGYGMYQWAKRLAHPLAKIGKPLIREILRLGNLRMQRAASLFDYQETAHLKSHIFSQEQYLFSEKELTQLLKPAYQATVNLNYANKGLKRALSPPEDQAFYDLQHYLKDDLLVKVDIASMHNSLEVRVPLLDHRLVEFSINLDESLKLKGNTSKYLLKEVLYEYVPAQIFDRPKWGFSIPLVKWLSTELRYLLDNYLNKAMIDEVGVVEYSYVQQLVKAFLAGKTFLYNRLWVLILLHKWWKENQ
ncbi:MAG: asparagine synthase (glutamine-hydrolyzing) [Flammeovirgaceae bacterium]